MTSITTVPSQIARHPPTGRVTVRLTRPMRDYPSALEKDYTATYNW